MQQKTLFTSARRRMRRAYWVAFKVGISYLALYTAKRFFGQSYYDKRISALHQKNARRVKQAIVELQGLFIKVGQMLSILSNFLPPAYEQELEELQDKVQASPYEDIKAKVEESLGAPIDELFDSFSTQALAAASIGQVHRARLKNGTEVVVKVQHQHIQSIAQVDLRIIKRLQDILTWWFSFKGMDHLYEQIKEMTEQELDFEHEALAMQKVKANLQEQEGLFIPDVHSAYSSQYILTSTWCSGVKISQIDQLKAWGIDLEDLVKRLLHAYCQMVFKDGYYHADPHPGNLLVQADGTLVLIDFGAIAVLNKTMREGFSELIEAAVRNDSQSMIEASKKMGFIAPGREAERMAEQLIDALRTFIQQEIKLENLNFKEVEINPFNNSLFDLISNVGLSSITSTVQVPKEYILLNRMATLLLGICNSLAPNLNPLDVVSPYVQNFVLGDKGNLLSFVSRILKETATDALAIPSEMHKVLKTTRQGNLEVRSLDSKQGAQLIYHALRQLSFSLLLIASAFASYMLWQKQELLLAKACALLASVWGVALWKALRAGARLRHQ